MFKAFLGSGRRAAVWRWNDHPIISAAESVLGFARRPSRRSDYQT